MFLNSFKRIPFLARHDFGIHHSRMFGLSRHLFQTSKLQECDSKESKVQPACEAQNTNEERVIGEIFPTARVVPMVLTNKDPVILSFDDVPGPKSLKFLSNVRRYLSEIGIQITVSVLTFGLNMGSYMKTKKPLRNLSVLFDEYGPVVRFISPIGGDIVLINHPDHIKKVYAMEGDYPIRSSLDSLEKYRMEHRNHLLGGLYSAHGQDWYRQRNTVYAPLYKAVSQHLQGINDICEGFTQKVYNMRNYQDEVHKDLYKELHKWAFDCMGLLLFAKRFTMLDTQITYSQCDMSWLYHSLEMATEAIVKCESGLHMWKFFTTPAWSSLVKHCDSLDSLIGKHVMEAEQTLSFNRTEEENADISLINAMLLGEEKMTAEDIATVIMDLLLIGVNTITSSTSFLLYHLAKYQRVQKILHKEVERMDPAMDIKNIAEETPYLQACIKETLRLVPPIPVLTRVLPKNITLDRYNIPRGTLIIMSPQEASLKERNYEDALTFQPERWLKADSKDYHAFASIPFGYGARKCLGKNIAETMMSLMVIRACIWPPSHLMESDDAAEDEACLPRIYLFTLNLKTPKLYRWGTKTQLLQKYKLEYHYGDIEAKRSFIAKPNRALKIRFMDRI